MAAPTVTIYLNTGTEASPTWTEVTSSHTIYFTGPDTTSTSIDPVTAPVSGTKIAEELWFGSSGSYTQCTTYTGAVNTNQNVLRVYFANNPTSTPPRLTYYDDTNHGSDPSDEIAAGTAGTGNTGWIKATETTSGAPPSNWCTATTGSSGGATTNCLDGDQRYVECASAASANTAKLFNIVCYVPSDASSGTAGHDGVLSVRYTYT
jgi:hypothetical protein